MSRSLGSVDGSLLIPTDKSSLMQVIEGKSADGVPEGTPCEMVEAEEPLLKILVVDAMGVLQSMKKTPAMTTLGHPEEAFVRRIGGMMTGHSAGRIVFDQYKEQSLKNATRKKRATTATEYMAHREMKLTMSLKDLLSAS